MNVNWFFRIPPRVRVLVILLALVLVVAVTCKPFVRWLNCESTHRFLALEPDHDPTGVGYDFSLAQPDAMWPKWTPDGDHIVFGTTLELTSQIHVVADDGSSMWTISEGGKEYTIDHSPIVSPDGARVAYSTYNHVTDEGRYYEIETAALDGSDKRRLTDKAGYDIAQEWLPNDRIAFRRNYTRECSHYFVDSGLYTMNPDGSDVRRILPDELGGDEYLGDFAWSPDGLQVAFRVHRWSRTGPLAYLDLVDADGSNRRRLIDVRGWPYEELTSGPVWSHDGARIALTAFQDDRLTLIAVNRDGIDREGVGLSEVVDVPAGGSLSWSPDGSQFILASSDTLYLVKADGSEVRRIESGHRSSNVWVSTYYAAWSPDGSRLAVVAPQKSDFLLYTVGADGSDVRTLVRWTVDGMTETVRTGQWLAADAASCSAGVVVPNPVVNPRLVRDCEALVAMMDRLPFVRLNWNADTPISEWEGVVLGDPNEEASTAGAPRTPLRVRGLSLTGHDLQGPVPDELTKLTGLRGLDLSLNNLHGPIPPELGELADLEALDLSKNSLGGVIPPEFGNLVKLKILVLSETELAGTIPPELGELANLKVLDLSKNFLGGAIPFVLGYLSALETLNLTDNKLSGPIPPELGNLQSLETLDIDGNYGLSGCIPEELRGKVIGYEEPEGCGG